MESNIIQHIYTLDWTVIAAAIGSITAIVAINIGLFSWLRSDIKSFDTKINSLEERMFYLSTGKTLSQAILDEQIKLKQK